MADFFSFFTIFLRENEVVIFSAIILFCLLLFVINLLIALIFKKYLIKKRVWVVFIYASACIFYKAVQELTQTTKAYFYILVSICLLLLIPILFLQRNLNKPSKKQIRLAKKFDKQAKQSSFSNCFSNLNLQNANQNKYGGQNYCGEVIPCIEKMQKMASLYNNQNSYDNQESLPMHEQSINSNTTNQNQQGLNIKVDFSHVKNVISRLDGIALSPADKRQVKELQSAILMVERGEVYPQTKNKINDGLGALLKIMAKYGV